MKRSRDVVIDLCSTDDEVDAAPPPAKKVAKIAPPAVSQPSTTNGARGGIGGFTPEERRKLEEARAARAAAAVAAGAITVAVQRSIDRPSTVATINTPASAPRASTSTAGSTGLLYPRAVVKPTYNIFAPDDPNAIKVTDLLGDRSQLRRVLLAAYCNALDWLVPNVLQGDFPVTLALHRGKEGRHLPKKPVAYPDRANMSCVFVPIDNTMHIKIWIIFFKTFTRIALPTGNNVDYDWDTVENAVWLQDFPLHSEGSKGHSFAAETEFGKTLERVLKNLTYPESEWRSFLDATNFGDIDERCRLVLSWPDPANRSPVANGHRALAQAIRDLDLAPLPSQQLVLEYQGSSLGSYKQDWLEQFYQSCVGGKPTPRQRFKRMRDVPIHPIFPSYQTVKDSNNGPSGGGTLFCNFWAWKSNKVINEFLQTRLRDGLSQRGAILMHTKTIIALFEQAKGKEDDSATAKRKTKGWAYVGSHNFTSAAWGRINKHGEYEIMNAELGVVFPIEAATEKEAEDIATGIATWQRPCVPYGPKGEPWMQDLHKVFKEEKKGRHR